MASVAITKRVHDCILGNLNESLRVRFNLLVYPKSPVHPDNKTKYTELIRDIMKAKVWGSLAHLESVFPAAWMKQINSVYVQYPLQMRIENAWTTVPMYRVPNAPSIYVDQISFDESVRDSDAYLEMPKVLEDSMADYMVALAEQKAFEDNARKILTTLLDSCKTLNAAVAKYPELTMYTPQQYIERMNQKVVAKKREVIASEEEMDFSALTSTAVLGRMSTGKEEK